MRLPRRSDQVRVDTSQCTPWPSGGLLVGGAVRDLLLGASPRDLDWLVEDPESTAREVAAAVGGSFFALDTARGHWRVVRDDRSFDFAPPRSGEAVSATDDLRARDLTINAMALRRDGALLDPCGGLDDLRAKRVRMTSPEAMAADAVRPLRAVRFAATLGFTMEARTDSLVRELAALQAREPSRLPAWERVRDELSAMMASPRAALAFALLDDVGLLDVYLPELARCRGVQQGGLHHTDVLGHAIEALHQLLRGFPDADAALRWATLLHDVGKPDTAERVAARRWTFYGHDARGRDLTLAALRRLRFPSDMAARAGGLVRYHMLPLPRDERGARRFVHRRRDLLPDLLKLMIADREAARGPLATAAGRRAYREALGQVLAMMAETPAPNPLLTGMDVMELLGLAPGPRVGEALRLVAEAVAVGDVVDRAGAEALLRRYAEAQGW
ncbi:MAG: HD domain-containing protein [Trueperaceae bacterium]